MRLYINVDHVATVRQARRTVEPDPVEAAALCERGGADGITVHLREDRRHIQDHDVHRLAAAITTVLNLELATSDDIVGVAVRLRPHQATLVPERREEITTEGGLVLGRDPAADRRIADTVRRLTDAGIRVSLFVDPDREVLDRSAQLGVAAVELHTGSYANAFPAAERELARLADAARHAAAAGLAVADIVLSFDGAAVKGVDDLHQLLNAGRIGAACAVTVIRAGRLETVSVVPADRRVSAAAAPRPQG